MITKPSNCKNAVSDFQYKNVNDEFNDENAYADVVGAEEDPETKCKRNTNMKWCKNNSNGRQCISKNYTCLNHRVLAFPQTARLPQ